MSDELFDAYARLADAVGRYIQRVDGGWRREEVAGVPAVSTAALHPPTEKEFQQAVVDLARLNGWLVYHPFDSRRSTPGYPDLTLARPPRICYVELKTDKGRITAEQQKWLDALAKCSVEVYVWRPSMWDEIERVLGRRQGG